MHILFFFFISLLLITVLACEYTDTPTPDFPMIPGLSTGPTETPRAGDAPIGPTLTPLPAEVTMGPTEPPPSNMYFMTTTGSYTLSVRTAFFTGSKHTYTCTGQNATIQMIIQYGTGAVNLYASIPNIDIYGDCSLVNGGAQSPFFKEFSGSLENGDMDSFINWVTCDAANSGRASGTVVSDTMITPIYPNILTADTLFRGGASCDTGDDTEGSSWSLDFTVYYQGEYKP